MTYDGPACVICNDERDDEYASGVIHHLNCEKCGRWICWDCRDEFGCQACKNDDRSTPAKQAQALREKVQRMGPEPSKPDHIEVRYKPRTWKWWARWGLIVVVCYVCGSWMSFQLRHPELTQVQAFLSFWEAMTWQ